MKVIIINNGLNKIKTILFNNHYSNLRGDDTQFSGSGTYDQFNAGGVNINGVELSLSRHLRFRNLIAPLEISYTDTKSEVLSNFESKFLLLYLVFIQINILTFKEKIPNEL